MVKNKECREKFDVIVKGKENEGYVEWKKWIIEQIKGYNQEQIQNLIKRNEIRLKQATADDGFSLSSFVAQCVTCLIAVITFLGSLIMTVLNIEIDAYTMEFEGESNLPEMVVQVMLKNASDVIDLVGIAVLFCILWVGFAVYKDARTKRKKNDDKIYYEELLIVLKNAEEVPKYGNRNNSRKK